VHTVVHFVDARVFGGTEKIIVTLLAGLDRNRWRPMLVCHPEPGLARLLQEARRSDVELRLVPRGGLSAIIQLQRVLRATRPSIFHAHLNWSVGCRRGLLAAALARVPAVVTTAQLFGGPERCPPSLVQQIASMTVDRFFAVSDWVARGLRHVSKVPERKIRVVRNGIPLRDFDRPFDGRLRARLSGGSRRPLVLTAARLDEQKGHKYLLEAAAKVPDAIFILAGVGRLRAELEGQARALKIDERVKFLGYRDDVADLLAVSDLFVLPSLFEGYPLSVMEAAAARKPIVATAVGGTDEAIQHGETGLLVPPADPAALAMAIRTLLADQALAARLAYAAQVRAREFSAETMCKRTSEAYEEVLSSRRG
jgi:glycosyltransferase involved in cell wall biosynthesis